MSRILILGALSDMARAAAHEFARHGYDVTLAGRNKQELEREASDLAVRHQIRTDAVVVDALKPETHRKFYSGLKEKPHVVLCAIGYLGDQELAMKDFAEARRILDTNYTGCVSLLNVVAEDFSERKEGVIIGISSVAGDRGRQSNYIYGSAKAAFSAYLSGLRNRMIRFGVHVMTVKPGFVRTRMTEGMKLPARLTAQPEEVARHIFQGYRKRTDVLYTKKIWRLIMWIIKHIPEPVFKRLSM